MLDKFRYLTIAIHSPKKPSNVKKLLSLEKKVSEYEKKSKIIHSITKEI